MSTSAAWCEPNQALTPELEELIEHWDDLSESEKQFVIRFAKFADKGCRTNKYIDAARPVLHPKQLKFLGLTDLEVLFGGSAGGSKAGVFATLSNAELFGIDTSNPNWRQVFNESYAHKVLTPFGFKPIDEIKVGDAVLNPDGTTCRVLFVHEPVCRKCFEVEFIDGAKCVVGEDHIWSTKISGKRNRRKLPDQYQTTDDMTPVQKFNTELFRRYKKVTTREMAEHTAKCEGNSVSRWMSVPLCEPCSMQSPPCQWGMIPPYTLGVLLGDGSLTGSSVSWSKPDKFIAEEIDREFAELDYEDWTTDRADNESHGICGGKTLRLLKTFKLHGCYAWDKFVPSHYLNAPIPVRRAVLQGLMDTDGCATEDGKCGFSTTSMQLAKDVQYLARSLGYCCTISDEYDPKYVYNGEKLTGRPAVKLYITGRNRQGLFRLPRKKDRVTELNNEGGRRVVAARELPGKYDCKCITVSHQNGLYITNDFVVTHNSDTLLVAAMQYVDRPDYSAVIFRKTYADLALPGAIMDRSHTFLSDSDAKWNDRDKRWTFPSGARLSFGYMDGPHSMDRYRSAEYTGIFFDECTEIDPACFLFMFSRLRKNKGNPIPLRFRAATNPGGKYGEFYKNRYIPQEYLDCTDIDYKFGRLWTKSETCTGCEGSGVFEDDRCFYCNGSGVMERKFLPARAKDNPSLDIVAYRKSLANVPYVTRMQMERGDWNISEEGGIFRHSWFRYYSPIGTGEYLKLHRIDASGNPIPDQLIARRDCVVFVTADTATKEKTTADYTVISTWALHRLTGSLILLDVIRKKVDTPEILPLLAGACTNSKASFVLIEEAASGIELIQKLRVNNQPIGGIPVKSYSAASKDKVARSVPAQIRMEAGMIYFPSEERPWKAECQTETISFGKAPHDDFVDNLSMAAWYAENHRHVFVGSSGSGPMELLPGPKLGQGVYRD